VFETELADFDVIFHLAAYVRTENNSTDVRINDKGTERLLSELRPRLEGKRFIYTSTIAAVDSPPAGGCITPQTPCRPRTDYGVTKLAAEQLLKEAAAKGGFSYTILRLPTVYGPGYRPGGMFDVVAKSLPRNTLSTRILWPGKMAIIQVHDLARILLQASGHPEMRDRTFWFRAMKTQRWVKSPGRLPGRLAFGIGRLYCRSGCCTAFVPCPVRSGRTLPCRIGSRSWHGASRSY
jgi:nucleoside-diphosphate-sugar epimerase